MNLREQIRQLCKEHGLEAVLRACYENAGELDAMLSAHEEHRLAKAALHAVALDLPPIVGRLSQVDTQAALAAVGFKMSAVLWRCDSFGEDGCITVTAHRTTPAPNMPPLAQWTCKSEDELPAIYAEAARRFHVVK